MIKVLSFVLLLMLMLGVIAFTLVFSSKASTASSTTINHSIYKAGTIINISGTVNGDVFCAGQTIDINGTINGDVLCLGEEINLNGTVNGNVRLIGSNLTVAADISKSASIAGQTITFDHNSKIGQDASLAGDKVMLNGKIGRDLSIASTSLVINASIGRNVDARTTDFKLENNAKINGNLSYTSPNKLNSSETNKVKGKITYNKVQAKQSSFSDWLVPRIFWLVLLTVSGVVLTAVFPRIFKATNIKYGKQFWWSMLVGLIAMLLIPVSIVFLLISVIGTYLGFILLLFWLAAVLLSMLFSAYFVGNLIVGKRHPVIKILIGSLVLAVLEVLPYVGWVFVVLAYWLGTGMILSLGWISYRRKTITVKAEA